jgi:hypothetical protein
MANRRSSWSSYRAFSLATNASASSLDLNGRSDEGSRVPFGTPANSRWTVERPSPVAAAIARSLSPDSRKEEVYRVTPPPPIPAREAIAEDQLLAHAHDLSFPAAEPLPPFWQKCRSTC